MLPHFLHDFKKFKSDKKKLKKPLIAMSCTAKEVAFDDWKEVDATALLESYKLELLYVQLLSYMKSMALF
jgi:hypothetical protein